MCLNAIQTLLVACCINTKREIGSCFSDCSNGTNECLDSCEKKLIIPICEKVFGPCWAEETCLKVTHFAVGAFWGGVGCLTFSLLKFSPIITIGATIGIATGVTLIDMIVFPRHANDNCLYGPDAV